jgi:hypothetical protein
MLLPEAGLDTLVDQFRALPSADRRAILSRLSLAQRQRVRARLRGAASPPGIDQASLYSADIAERVAAPGEESAVSAMTSRGKAALARAAATQIGTVQPPRTASLLEAVARLWLGRTPA